MTEPADQRMARALLLARGGRGRVEPNPMVGAVVVRDGEIVGHGHHARFGGPHAEAAALDAAGDRASGATVYVTLEPCGHEGKTPACAQRLVDAGVRRVVYAAADPNPITEGKGPAILVNAGIELIAGVLADEARALNPRYEAHLGADLPWTIAKWAMTLDGHIADVDGGSKYITGKESLRLVHEIRGAVDAIAVGVGTVGADDPDLTVRDVTSTRAPVRVVFDSHLRTPPESKLVRTAGEMPTWLFAREGADTATRERLEKAGCRILAVPAGDAGHIDLAAAFRTLKSEGIHRVLLEGGGEIHASAFAAGVVHQVMAFVAPKLLGGRTAPSPIGGEGFRRIAKAMAVEEMESMQLGDDVLLEGFVNPTLSPVGARIGSRAGPGEGA